MSDNRNIAIDKMKLIAAFLVVAIHVSPFQSINGTADFIVTRVIARIAVPFFFMVSGYFVLGGKESEGGGKRNKEQSGKHGDRVSRFMKKTAFLYLAATLLYLPVNLYAGNFKGLTFGQGLKDLLFDGTFYHLWYLPAVLLGMALCLAFLSVFGEKTAFGVSLFLYGIGLFGDSYYGLISRIPFMEKFYEKLFAISSYTRNGVFFAPVFLMLGYFAAKRRNGKKQEVEELERTEELKEEAARQRELISTGGLSAVLLLLMIGEGLILHKLNVQKHDSMYVLLIPLMYVFFRFICAFPSGRKQDGKVNGAGGKKRKVYGDMSMMIYIIHPLVLIVLRGISKPLGLYDICVENTLICYILVSVISAAAAWILARVLHGISRSYSDRTGSRRAGNYAAGYRETVGREAGKGAAVYPETAGRKAGKDERRDLQTDRAWIEINPDHLRHNVEQIRNRLPKGCRLMAVVKANAYGHGDAVVAKLLNEMGVKSFAVASLEEGARLRKEGIKGKILVLGYTDPQNAGYLAKYRLVQTVVDDDYAKRLNGQGVPVKVHIKVDTGMHRLGEDSGDLKKIMRIFRYGNLEVEGVFSHLCVADSNREEDIFYTEKQIKRFEGVLDEIRRIGYAGIKTHLQSSYGMVNHPELHYDYVRVGIMMYGCLSRPGDYVKEPLDLRGVLTLKARIALVRKLKKGDFVGYGCTFKAPCDMMMAAVTIGYGDGYPRTLSGGKGYVLVKGQKAPIIGRICMDQMTVDVTGIDGVCPGDEVILIGEDGGACIRAEEVAQAAGTIANELLCRLGSRLGHVTSKNDRN